MWEMLYRMPKTTTNCPECGKTGIRSDHLKRHMDTHKGKTPVPVRNSVVMEESDEALLDAAADFVQAMTAKQAAKKSEKAANTVQTLRERFPVEMFIEEKKAICARIVREEHKWIRGSYECTERCLTSRYRGTCPGVVPWSINQYGGQREFDALYESWLKKKAGVA